MSTGADESCWEQVTDERLRYDLRPDLAERQPQPGISLPEPGEARYGQWSGGAAGSGWPRAQQWQVHCSVLPSGRQ